MTKFTPEQQHAMMQAHIESCLNAPKQPYVRSKTCLSYWFPLIEAAGLPVPKTRIIDYGDPWELIKLCDGDTPDNWQGLLDRVAAAVGEIGLPCFLRTGQTSAKHDWKKTCFLEKREDISGHIAEIVMFSGCVDLETDTWVVREMIKTRPMFTAFHGAMPITREFRFFMKDGECTHVQPYWPADAIDGHQPSIANWRDLLEDASKLDAGEFLLLLKGSQKANAAVPGYWSIDWLETADRGWVLTDMAEVERSYKWDSLLSQQYCAF